MTVMMNLYDVLFLNAAIATETSGQMLTMTTANVPNPYSAGEVQ